MKVVKYKESLLRRGIDIYCLIQLPRPEKGREYVCLFGLEFWKGQSLGIDMIFYSEFNVREEGAVFASRIDPNWTYAILPDYQYEIFNDLELVGECSRNLLIKYMNEIRIDWEVFNYLENTIKSYESRTLQTEPN